jgi:hypothetical protein
MAGGVAKDHAAGFSEDITPVKTGDGFSPVIEKGDVTPTINGQHADVKVIQNDF